MARTGPVRGASRAFDSYASGSRPAAGSAASEPGKRLKFLEQDFRGILNVYGLSASISKKSAAVDLRVAINLRRDAAAVLAAVHARGSIFYADQQRFRHEMGASGLGGHLKLEHLLKMAAIGHASGWGAPLDASAGAAHPAPAAANPPSSITPSDGSAPPTSANS